MTLLALSWSMIAAVLSGVAAVSILVSSAVAYCLAKRAAEKAVEPATATGGKARSLASDVDLRLNALARHFGVRIDLVRGFGWNRTTVLPVPIDPDEAMARALDAGGVKGKQRESVLAIMRDARRLERGDPKPPPDEP